MNKLVISLVVLLAGNVWSMNSQTSVVNKQLEIAVTALDEVKSPADLLLAQQSAQGIMPHWGIFRMQ